MIYNVKVMTTRYKFKLLMIIGISNIYIISEPKPENKHNSVQKLSEEQVHKNVDQKALEAKYTLHFHNVRKELNKVERNLEEQISFTENNIQDLKKRIAHKEDLKALFKKIKEDKKTSFNVVTRWINNGIYYTNGILAHISQIEMTYLIATEDVNIFDKIWSSCLYNKHLLFKLFIAYVKQIMLYATIDPIYNNDIPFIIRRIYFIHDAKTVFTPEQKKNFEILLLEFLNIIQHKLQPEDYKNLKENIKDVNSYADSYEFCRRQACRKMLIPQLIEIEQKLSRHKKLLENSVKNQGFIDQKLDNTLKDLYFDFRDYKILLALQGKNDEIHLYEEFFAQYGLNSVIKRTLFAIIVNFLEICNMLLLYDKKDLYNYKERTLMTAKIAQIFDELAVYTVKKDDTLTEMVKNTHITPENYKHLKKLVLEFMHRLINIYQDYNLAISPQSLLITIKEIEKEIHSYTLEQIINIYILCFRIDIINLYKYFDGKFKSQTK